MSLLQRRRYLINRSQVHLIVMQVLYYGLFLIVLSIGLLGPLVMELSRGPGGPEQVGLARVLLYMHGRFWGLAGLMIAIATVHSVFLTHRVVGPLVRFRRAFRDVAAGRLTRRIVLRRKDYLTEEADEINAMCASLAARVVALRAVHRQALDELRDLDHELEGARGPRAALEALHARLEELRAGLAWFDCEDEGAATLVSVDDPPAPFPDRARREEAPTEAP